MQQQIYSVSQINSHIQQLMDSDVLLSSIAVSGEISNYKVYPSGHHYFSLKDESASIRCVMFRSSAMRLRFRPSNGMRVVAVGKISVYPRDGAYQLYCNLMFADGVGDLHIAFEQLKERLMERGLFDPSHKKPLPQFPKTVGVVTSSAGAAVHDIIRIIRKRFPATKIRLFPVRVQGDEAPDEIVSAIEFANTYELADVLIVGRGGGSMEDLWAFNDERVAYAIFRSTIPVISAVGHEPDVTIADYVADVRAATPSNGAELAVPDKDMILQTLDLYAQSMSSSLRKKIKAARTDLSYLSSSQALQNMDLPIKQRKAALDSLQHRLLLAQNQLLQSMQSRYQGYAGKLDALSPLKVISRGYAIVRNSQGLILRCVHQLRPGDQIQVIMKDGSVFGSVTDIKENQDES